MANPTKYVKDYDFAGFQEAQPKSPLPATRVDNELLNVEQSIGETIDALRDVRRDDGALKNQIVTPDSLSAATRTLLARDINPRGVWASGGQYAAKDAVTVAGASYLAVTPHTASATFADDLAAGAWLLIANPYSLSGEAFSQVFNGDGVTTVFPLSQEFTSIAELAVYVQDGSSGFHRMRSAGAAPQVSLGGPTQLVFSAAPGEGVANIVVEAVNQTAASASASARQSADASEAARDVVQATISSAVDVAVADAQALADAAQGYATSASNDAAAAASAVASVPFDNPITIASDHTVTAAEHGWVFTVDASAAGVDVTAPNSADTSPAIDEPFTFWVVKSKEDTSANTVRVYGGGTDTVGGSEYYEITKAGAGVKVVLDEGVTPANWIVIEFGAATGDAEPLGFVKPFFGVVAPIGYVALNGVDVSAEGYSALTAYTAGVMTALGYTNATAPYFYRHNDLANPSASRSETGTYLKVPDWRDRFFRNAGAGRLVGAVEEDAFQGHAHGLDAGSTGSSTRVSAYNSSATPATINTLGPISDGVNGTPRTANETRPKNVALLWCIKAAAANATAPGEIDLAALLAETQAQNALVAGINAGEPDYDSGWMGVTLNSSPTFSHALGVVPKEVAVQYRCLVAQGLAAVGDMFEARFYDNGSGLRGVGAVFSATQIKLRVPSQISIPPSSGDTPVTITAANWEYRVIAFKGTTLTGGGGTALVPVTPTAIAQGIVTVPHSLGRIPTSFQLFYEAVNANMGFSVGDRHAATPWPTGVLDTLINSHAGFEVLDVGPTAIQLRFVNGYSSTKTIALRNKSTGARADVFNADWRIVGVVS